jgi:hypothetical protein
MSDHPSSHSADVPPAAVGQTPPPPKSSLPEGTWVTRAALREYPDRKVVKPNNEFGPIHPENGGWVWPGKMRAGDLVVVVGEPGTGKSTLMADWIARVTTGAPFPHCEVDQALPPGDVVLFNARDDFARAVIPAIAAAGGDVDRVYRGSERLLKSLPQDRMVGARFFWGNTGGVKLHLSDERNMAALHKFVSHRPSLRMLVIDSANLHLRCGSERQFDVVVQGLLQIAQECEVAVVLTMQPDAFRRGEGVSKYLQSRSLKENAHSVWRLAAPTDPEIPGRLLEIVKTTHEMPHSGTHGWHLVRTDEQRLEWSEAGGTELAPGKDLLKHRDLVRVQEFLDQILLVLGGLVYWKVLADQAAKQGIQPGLLRQAVTYWNLPSMYEPHEGGLLEVIGVPELIALRKEEQRAQQAAAREALRTGQSPSSGELPAGLVLAPSSDPAPAPTPAANANPQKTSVEPPSSPASSPLAAPPTAERASFIKPELTAGRDGATGDGEPELEGTTAPRTDAKPLTKTPKKVAQAL